MFSTADGVTSIFYSWRAVHRQNSSASEIKDLRVLLVPTRRRINNDERQDARWAFSGSSTLCLAGLTNVQNVLDGQRLLFRFKEQLAESRGPRCKIRSCSAAPSAAVGRSRPPSILATLDNESRGARLCSTQLRFAREGVRGQLTEALFVSFREVADMPEAPLKRFRGDRRCLPVRLFEGLVDAMKAQS